jgi:topoisomerase-4 subunit A
MESIVKANDQGKIKIKKVTDNTAAEVEILVELAAGISADITIDALYAFTDCEVSIAPNACVISDQRPLFLSVSELLKASADYSKDLLKKELEIRLSELQEKWHYTSLERIFFEEKIYKELEKKHETWEKVLLAIEAGFNPFKKVFKREVTREDVIKLTEKPVRRIYKLDIEELNAQIKGIESEIKQVKHDLNNLVDYAVAYFEGLRDRFGKGKERKTEIKLFDTIQARQVAIANVRLYMNRAEGFIGTSLKKDEFITECSDLDDIIVFTRRGIMKVVKVDDKVYIGKDILHAAIFTKNDQRTTYNMIYTDGDSGVSFAKRFNVTGITRDKDYDLTKGSDKSKLNYFTVNPNGEAESVQINLSPNCSARNKQLDFFFESLDIKGRSSIGNQVTKYPIKSVKLKDAGKSTIGGIDLWFDDVFGRLNVDSKGTYLGNFLPEDQLLVIHHDGYYEINNTELTQRFNPDTLIRIEKFDPLKIVTAIYLDNEKLQFNVKRFKVETTTLNNKFYFIKEADGNYVEAVTTETNPIAIIRSGRGSQAKESKIKIADFIEVMGWKAAGNKLTDYTKSTEIDWLDSGKNQKKQAELF